MPSYGGFCICMTLPESQKEGGLRTLAGLALCHTRRHALKTAKVGTELIQRDAVVRHAELKRIESRKPRKAQT